MPKDALDLQTPTDSAKTAPRNGKYAIDEDLLTSDGEYVDPGMDDGEAIADIFSRCPADEGYHANVYRLAPLPKDFNAKRLLLFRIDHPELLSDFESDILKLAQENEWCDGQYEICVFKTGKKGVHIRRKVSLQVPKTKLSPAALTPPTAAVSPTVVIDPFTSIDKAMKMFKDAQIAGANGNSGQAVDPIAITRAVAEAYKAGAEAATARSAGNAPPSGESLAEIVKAVLGSAPKPPDPLAIIQAIEKSRNDAPKPVQNDPIDILVKLKEAGILPDTRQLPVLEVPRALDPLDMLIKLRQSGLIPDPNVQRDDPSKVLELVTALIPLMNGSGGGEGGSAAQELIRVLGPQAGKMVSDITSTIRDAIALRKNPPQRPTETVTVSGPRQVSAGAEMVEEPTTYQRLSTPPPITSSRTPPQPTSAVEEEKPMLPVFRAIKGAVDTHNVAFFPQLRSLLQRITTEQQFDDIIAGNIPLDNVVGQVAQFGGTFFLSPEAKAYFAEAIEWARKEKAAEVVASCSKCNVEYVFGSKEELEQSPTCPDCNTTLSI